MSAAAGAAEDDPRQIFSTPTIRTDPETGRELRGAEGQIYTPYRASSKPAYDWCSVQAGGDRWCQAHAVNNAIGAELIGDEDIIGTLTETYDDYLADIDEEALAAADEEPLTRSEWARQVSIDPNKLRRLLKEKGFISHHIYQGNGGDGPDAAENGRRFLRGWDPKPGAVYTFSVKPMYGTTGHMLALRDGVITDFDRPGRMTDTRIEPERAEDIITQVARLYGLPRSQIVLMTVARLLKAKPAAIDPREVWTLNEATGKLEAPGSSGSGGAGAAASSTGAIVKYPGGWMGRRR